MSGARSVTLDDTSSARRISNDETVSLDDYPSVDSKKIDGGDDGLTKPEPDNEVQGLIKKMKEDQNMSPAMVMRLTKAIRMMDVDGDGDISADEIIYFVMKEVNEAQKVNQMKKAMTGLIMFVVLLVVGNFGLSIAVAIMTKQTDVSGAEMRDMSGNAVQLASSDFDIDEDGKMGVRGSTDGKPMRTAAATKESKLTSRTPDKYVRQLQSFYYTDPASGEAAFVTVKSFSRKPTAGALCGSVLVLHTTDGDFTLDDEHLYVGGVEVDVTGNFATEGRRRLNAADISGFFDYVADGEDEPCVRSWEGEETVIAPTQPALPASYTLEEYKMCPIGNAECESYFAANAGEKLPGYHEPTNRIRVTSHVLETNAMTVKVSRLPNHPMQRQVKITYTDRIDENGVKVHDEIEFQQFADDMKRLRCSKGTVEVIEASNFKFENLIFSFLGTDLDSGDRRFRLSPKDENGEVDEDGNFFEMWEKVADPDTGTLAHPTRSYAPKMPDVSDSRFKEYKQGLDQHSIDKWLDNELFGAYDEIKGEAFENVTCYSQQSGIVYETIEIPEVPAILNYYNEDPDKVRTYASLIEQFSVKYLNMNTKFPQLEAAKKYWGRFRPLVPVAPMFKPVGDIPASIASSGSFSGNMTLDDDPDRRRRLLGDPDTRRRLEDSGYILDGDELPKYVDHFGEERRLSIDFIGNGMCDDLAPVCSDDDDKCNSWGQLIYKKMTKTLPLGTTPATNAGETSLHNGATLNHHFIQHKLPTDKFNQMTESSGASIHAAITQIIMKCPVASASLEASGMADFEPYGCHPNVENLRYNPKSTSENGTDLSSSNWGPDEGFDGLARGYMDSGERIPEFLISAAGERMAKKYNFDYGFLRKDYAYVSRMDFCFGYIPVNHPYYPLIKLLRKFGIKLEFIGSLALVKWASPMPGVLDSMRGYAIQGSVGVYANIDTTLCASYEWGGVRFTRIVHLTGTISATIQASYDSAKKAGKLAGIIQVQGLGAVVYDGQTFLDNGIPYIGPLWGEENNNGDNLCWWDGNSQPGISAGTQYTASLKIELSLSNIKFEDPDKIEEGVIAALTLSGTIVMGNSDYDLPETAIFKGDIGKIPNTLTDLY